jgi:hypothetical protein
MGVGHMLGPGDRSDGAHRLQVSPALTLRRAIGHRKLLGDFVVQRLETLF